MADTTQTHSQVVPSEYIEAQDDAMRRALNLADPTILRFADARGVPQGEGATVDIPWADDHQIPAGTKAEGAEAPIVTTSHSKAQVTAGTIAWKYKVPLELVNEARINKIRQNARLGTQKMMQRRDVDGLSLITSLAYGVDASGQPLTEDRFLSALFQYDAQEPDAPMGTWFVAGSRQYEDWTQDLRSDGAQWTSNETEAAKIIELIKPGVSFRGVRHGIACVRSNAAPVTNGNRHCAFAAIGETSPFIYRSWWPTRIDIAWMQGAISFEQVVSSRFGWGKGRDEEGFEVIVRNAA